MGVGHELCRGEGPPVTASDSLEAVASALAAVGPKGRAPLMSAPRGEAFHERVRALGGGMRYSVGAEAYEDVKDDVAGRLCGLCLQVGGLTVPHTLGECQVLHDQRRVAWRAALVAGTVGAVPAGGGDGIAEAADKDLAVVLDADAAEASMERGIQAAGEDREVWWRLSAGAAVGPEERPDWLAEGWNVAGGRDPHLRSRRRVLAATAEWVVTALGIQRRVTVARAAVIKGKPGAVERRAEALQEMYRVATAAP